MATRTEEDFIGKVQVPANAYYGIFTVRASGNFQISSHRPSRNFIRMLALVKKSAAEANVQTGALPTRIGGAIARAAAEAAEGKFDSQFILDSFTAGAGTPFNMNMNEVLANRAEELLGGRRGSYKLVHPNNHVNMSQSSNDAIPTAIRLALLYESQSVIAEAEKLAAEIEKKSRDCANVIKVGRTHLMDAVPLTVGDELSAFSSALRKDILHLQSSLDSLRELPIGGTALGSGINTHPDYRRLVVRRIAANTGIRVSESRNLFRAISQSSDFLAYSSSLRSLAAAIHKISNDFKLLSSGPNTAIGEYILPEVEPGSSIMPGKVNPSVPECAEMIAVRVIANDSAVLLATLGGQLQLNVQTPLILHSLSESNHLLANGCKMLREHCISGLKLNRQKIQQHLEASLISLTALAPYFGYAKMSSLVKKAQKEGKSIKQVVLEEKLLTEQQYDRLMSPQRLTRPSKKEKL
ncbi:MAG: aspartate ammonia-lyase [Candidatus Anstonellaceae archaeon]